MAAISVRQKHIRLCFNSSPIESHTRFSDYQFISTDSRHMFHAQEAVDAGPRETELFLL